MNRFLLIASGFLLFAGQVLAGPADFARGRVLDPDGGSVVQRVAVPVDVYEWVTRADLGDVRVFNSAQDEVPYAIRRPQTQDEYSPWQAIPLFSLPMGDTGTGANANVRVEIDGVGAIVSIAGQATSARPSEATFLLDTSALRFSPTEMQIEWAREESADFIGKVKIEASDDLDVWRTFVSATTIASLTTGSHDITVDRIDLPGKSVRYLRLTQIEGSEQISLTRVQVRHRQSQLPLRRWKALEPEQADDAVEFASGGLFPIDRLTLVDADPGENFLVSAELFSRTAPDQVWRSRGTRSFYRTTINGVTVQSDPLPVGHRDQFWRAEFKGEGLAAPVLRIGWLPDEVVFLKQGPVPYVLVYGQADLEGRQWPLKRLLSQLNGDDELVFLAKVPVAGIGAAEMLGGPDRLIPPEEPVNWQTVVLWVVLVLGVVVVGVFAWRLLKT